MVTKSTDLAPIRRDEIYALELFYGMVGLGEVAIRNARRAGLAVEFLHGRGFIRGSAWLDYCEEFGKSSKNGEGGMSGR